MAWISKSYKNDIKIEIEKLHKSLVIKKDEYENFIKSQKDSWDFDYEKRSELMNEVSIIENNIWDKEKILNGLV